MDLPKRKPNRLLSFDHNAPGAYFITICTKDRKCILWDTVGASIARPSLSYYGHIVRGKQDYLKIWEYIDGNPSKWQEDCFYVRQ